MWRRKKDRPEAPVAEEPMSAEEGERPPKRDPMVTAIRQRRVLSAAERVQHLPGFFGLNLRPRTLLDSDVLDHRRRHLEGEPVRQEWATAEVLAAALRATAPLLSDVGGNLLMDEEPEARWVHVTLGALLDPLGGVLARLNGGFTILGDDDRALLVEVRIDLDGHRSFVTSRYGDWPAGTLPA